MALIPLLLDYLDQPRPSRVVDQQFGNALTTADLFAPLQVSRQMQHLLHYPGQHYYRPWRSTDAMRDIGSTVSVEKDKFSVNLDVQQFTPEEISVKVTDDNTIIVEGKHEEKQDDHGFISRHFVRRYVVPKGHNLDHIESKLSSDGVLAISVPKEKTADVEHRNIPIVKTGQPLRQPVEAKAVENGSEEGK